MEIKSKLRNVLSSAEDKRMRELCLGDITSPVSSGDPRERQPSYRDALDCPDKIAALFTEKVDR